MQNTRRGRLYSASDLVNFTACSHLTRLDLVNLDIPLLKAEETDEMALIQGKGFEHEDRYLAHLTQKLGIVTNLRVDSQPDATASEATQKALQQGRPALFQATFLNAPWVGHADFLTRVEVPSALGNFSYEVEDTKLARSSKAKFLIQMCLYSELLAEVQGVMPRHMHVILGDGRRETYQVDNYLRYYRRVKERFLEWVEKEAIQSYPERNERCDICRWRDICTDQWQRDDHLNRVANITRQQTAKLQASGVITAAALAELPASARVQGIQPSTRERLSHQARLQMESRASNRSVFELLPILDSRGFGRLPQPAEGDLFFDMEGDPLEEGGLEYLFGLYFFEAGQSVFKPFWAHSRSEERTTFETFMDWVSTHLARWPNAFIYHYAPYELTALKKLMSVHGTLEEQVDNLLRHHKLVDLYSVVREALRVGEPSYSIKYIERFYSQGRLGEVKTAGASIVFYEKWKATEDVSLLKAIEDYNHDDVRSTFELRQWLVGMRPSNATWFSGTPEGDAPTKKKSEAAEKAALTMETYRSELLSPLPEDRLSWTDEHRVRELLFQLLGFHRRADKPAWWALFERQQASQDELLDDIEVLASLEQASAPYGGPCGSHYIYRFPEQDCKLKTGDRCTVVSTMKEVSNVVIDEDARTVSFSLKSAESLSDVGVALGGGLPIDTRGIQGAIRRFVDGYLTGYSPYEAGLSLLRRNAPKVAGTTVGESLIRNGEPLLQGTARIAQGLTTSFLFIQGPPGAGKTFTGSHVIVDLIRTGKTVGVASNSHKAINNLLQAVEQVAEMEGVVFEGAKKSTSEDSCLNGKFIADVFESKAIVEHANDYALIAGTAWLFVSPMLDQKLDYLFVDEAGQVSLANLIAMSTCAKNLVLLGDQMQLGQPIQGLHPGESGQSTLEYLLQGEATIAPAFGVFLKDTWRMHPEICGFISSAVYDGRLEAEPKNTHQRLVLSDNAHPLLRPTGLAFVSAEHDGCSQRSDEEAEMVKQLFESLLTQRFVDRDGAEHAMGLSNILVVAPYNLQVNLLKRLLPPGARVGTVDKFQGQEAEAVLVSMTTSSSDYLPRDIEFLYSKNRLNVAISRARSFVAVIASPRLLDVACKSPEQMALVNTLCWVKEYAEK